MIDKVSIYSGTTVAAAQTSASNFVEVDVSTKTTWAKAFLNFKFTNGSAAVPVGESITINCAWSTFTGIASANVANLKACAKQWTIRMPDAASAVSISLSDTTPAAGASLYVWISHDTWQAARTVDAWVGGLPA